MRHPRVIVTRYPAHPGVKGRIGTIQKEGNNENWWIVNVKGLGRMHLARHEFRFITPLEELARAGE